MKKNAGPASRIIKTVEAFNKFISNENAVLVGKIADLLNFSLFFSTFVGCRFLFWRKRWLEELWKSCQLFAGRLRVRSRGFARSRERTFAIDVGGVEAGLRWLVITRVYIAEVWSCTGRSDWPASSRNKSLAWKRRSPHLMWSRSSKTTRKFFSSTPYPCSYLVMSQARIVRSYNQR